MRGMVGIQVGSTPDIFRTLELAENFNLDISKRNESWTFLAHESINLRLDQWICI